MRPTTLKTLASLAFALLAPLAAQAQAAAQPSGAATARVIVKYKSDSTLLRKQAASASLQHEAQAQALGARVGLPLRSGRGVAERTHVVFASGMSSDALAARLLRENDVEYAVPDRLKRRTLVPNDALFAAGGVNGPATGQWYLKAPAGEVRSSINAVGAWDLSTGSASVVVAVLDTGVRFDHTDFKRVSANGNLLDGYDMIRDLPTANDGSPRDGDASDPGDFLTQADIDSGSFAGACTAADITDSSWHGTQMAGLIGAVSGNSIGMASVGQNVRVLPVRVLGKCGGFDSDIIAGMRWAAGLGTGDNAVPPNPNRAQVVNLSLGGAGSCSLAYAEAVSALAAAGTAVVASAGNSAGHAVSEPANCEGVIGVAGLRHTGTKVGFSDLGPEISISAPGGNCVNTLPTDPCLYPILTTSNAGRTSPVAGAGGAIYTDSFNVSVGTSYSAPLVAGTAALMLSVRPDLSPTELRRFLRATARAFPQVVNTDCEAPTSIEQLECNCTPTTCGAGMLDAATAVIAAANDPIVRIDVTPAQPVAGALLTLTSAQTALVAGRNVASWQWTLVSGGGIVSSLTGANTAAASATPTAGGSFIVTLAVTDTAGRTGSQTVEVSVAPPPSSGGGGGALGLGWLAALLTAVVALRRAEPAARGA